MSRSLQELAELTQARLAGNPDHRITGVEDLASAGPEEASFLSNPLYRSLLETTQAGVVCIDSKTPVVAGKDVGALVVIMTLSPKSTKPRA